MPSRFCKKATVLSSVSACCLAMAARSALPQLCLLLGVSGCMGGCLSLLAARAAVRQGSVSKNKTCAAA